jgi:hypothetical protein
MTTSNSQKSAKDKWEITKEIINDMCVGNNRVFTDNEVYEEFKKRYPDKVNSNPVKAKKSSSEYLKMMSVNSQSRLSYLRIYGMPSPGKILRNPMIKGSSSEYPRISNPKNERDFLYDLGKGKYEIYEPSKHGIWEIVLDEDDVNHLTLKNKPNYDSQANLLLNLSSEAKPAQLEPVLVLPKTFAFQSGHNEGNSSKLISYEEYNKTIDLEHNKIQSEIYKQLANKYGKENIGTENYTGNGTRIDLVVKHEKSFTFYEIKTGNSALQCIREAFGQLIEYANFKNDVEIEKFIIVSPNKLNSEIKTYLEKIRKKYSIPIYYQYFEIQSKKLSELE